MITLYYVVKAMWSIFVQFIISFAEVCRTMREALWRTFTVKACFKRSIPHIVKKAVLFSNLGGLTLASSTKQEGNFE